MKGFTPLTVVLGLLPLVLAQSSTPYYSPQPSPMPCAGACVDPDYKTLSYQDTTIVRRPGVDGAPDMYYRFSKGDNTGDGINVATSPALAGNWTYQGTIINNVDTSDCMTNPKYAPYNFTNADLNRWAPEVHNINGTYYLFYTVEDQAHGYCFDLNVATSPNLEMDSWTNWGTMDVPDFDITAVRRIDGTILADASDPQGAVLPFMAYGSWQYGLYGVELTDDYLKAKSGSRQTLLVLDQNQDGGNKTEGAYLLRNNGYIYIFYSRGACCDGVQGTDPASVYITQVCRTPESTPWGPYLDRGNNDCTNGPTSRVGSTILANAEHTWEPGSVSTLLDPTEGLVMTYQYVPQNPGGVLSWSWNYMAWGADGWPYLTQSR